MRSNHTTLDLVIKDTNKIMCLLHVMHHSERTSNVLVSSTGCLRLAKCLKFKMKVGYECWKQN